MLYEFLRESSDFETKIELSSRAAHGPRSRGPARFYKFQPGPTRPEKTFKFSGPKRPEKSKKFLLREIRKKIKKISRILRLWGNLKNFGDIL